MQTQEAQTILFRSLAGGLGRKLNRVNAKKLLYRKDPVGYIRHYFKSELWGGAQDVCNAVAESNRSSVSVRAGHGTQKTFTAARLGLWFWDVYRPSKVITTAPTGRQVEKLLWTEIGTAWKQARAIDPAYPGRLLLTEIKTNDPNWFMFGFAANEDVNAEGFHSENIFIVVDEAKGVDARIFEAFEGALGGVNARRLYISTPGPPDGDFYESFRDSNFSTFHHSVDSMLRWYEKKGIHTPSGCATREWLSNCEKKWGKNSNRYKMRCDAEFCESVPEAIIPISWVERSFGVQRPKTQKGVLRLGADIAEFGDDTTVIFIGDDAGEVACIQYEKKELTETAGQIISAARKYKVMPHNITIDSTGIGSGVGSMLRAEGFKINCINFAERSSDSQEWADIPTEMYWGLRERLSVDGFFLSAEHKEIREDLSRRKYGMNRNGAFQLESKKDFKRRIGRSPDFGDAIALCYFRRISGVAPGEDNY